MLPTNLGETMRTVQDEAFFELRPLKHKVQAIGTTVHVIWKLTLPRHHGLAGQQYFFAYVMRVKYGWLACKTRYLSVV